VRSYGAYIEELLRIRDVATTHDGAATIRLVPPLSELWKQRPFFRKIYLVFMAFYFATVGRIGLHLAKTSSDVGARWAFSIAVRVFLGLSLTPEQREWLSAQDFGDQIAFNVLSELKGLMAINIFMIRSRLHQAVTSAAIEIAENDRLILKKHIDDLRGNPRSIKRFINTYLLAKSMSVLAESSQPSESFLKNVAAWLVLLQNWPREGSVLSSSTPSFQEGWINGISSGGPSDLKTFIDANREQLEGLAMSRYGLDIARCFSFFNAEK